MNVDQSTTEGELLDAFKKKTEGAYRVKMLYDKEGHSKGAAFIEYNSNEQAKNAVSNCQSIEVGNKKLLVQMARPV